MKRDITLKEFKTKMFKGIPHKHSIINSVGVKDIFKIIRKNKWPNIGLPINISIWLKIIRQVNNCLCEELLTEGRISFPMHLGRIVPTKLKKKVYIENGKVKSNLTTDWQATVNLWYEDLEAFENRTIVKHNKEETYIAVYRKNIFNPSWFRFFYFKPNQALHRRYSRKISAGELKIYTL